MERDYRTIAEIAKAEDITELMVWSRVRHGYVKSFVSPTGKVVISNAEWYLYADSEEGMSWLDENRRLYAERKERIAKSYISWK